MTQRILVRRHRFHLIVGERRPAFGRHWRRVLLRLGNAVRDGVDDELIAPIAVQPLAVGEVRRHRGALGVLTMAGAAGPAAHLSVEDAVAEGDLLWGAATTGARRLGGRGLLGGVVRRGRYLGRILCRRL